MNEESGNLTKEQFNMGIDKFVEKCKVLNEHWCICRVENAPDERYLMKREIIAAAKVENTRLSVDDDDETEEYFEDEMFADNALCSGNKEEQKTIVTFEYHVVYSCSYCVPVLYFSAWTQDGKLLSLDDIWKQVPQMHQDFLKYDKWSFITQQEHPLLHRPYFLVHPCHTADFMRQLSNNKCRGYDRDFSLYLTTWLSAVGPVVGIQLPLQLAMPHVNTDAGFK